LRRARFVAFAFDRVGGVRSFEREEGNAGPGSGRQTRTRTTHRGVFAHLGVEPIDRPIPER